ncbi:MAG TPA: 30S ribosomal protein S12 methylthiotransferase RimO [Candidatus Paceibacterota bacterium]|nr:30S ribosomal protein S12 methylthiotransferase RimO [Candidatus Paceibacterota bacterium]
MSGHENQARPLRVGLISLGCAKNLVDAEIMLGALLRDGCEITNDPAASDAVIVNTCSFIADAQEESVDAILESARIRDTLRPNQALIVSGCLPQRFRDDLPKALPEVDAFMGIDQVTAVARIVRKAVARRNAWLQKVKDARPVLTVSRRPVFIPDCGTPRFRLTPRHLAYVKIAEGCNHACSFCIIPRMRGSHRSRPQHDIVEEARRLLAEGAKELNLISQDSTCYGLDLRPRPDGRTMADPRRFGEATRALPAHAETICSLVRALNDLPGDFWIRLLYTHPAHWTDALIETIAQCRKVARYVDIPIQHIHPVILEEMRRRTPPQHITDLLRRIRARIPGIVLRTTFIVGFPGETDAHFKTLLEFIRTTRFERMGVFAYSPEKGTAAGRMPKQVPEPIRQRRRDRAMAVQKEIAREHGASQLGRHVRVLIEGTLDAARLDAVKDLPWNNGLARVRGRAKASWMRGVCAVGRTEADAPEIDGRVYVPGRLPLGAFVSVRILDHADYDLFGERVYE